VVRPGVGNGRRETIVLAQESARLIDQGAVQFILFGVMIIIVFITLWFTISK
jgi:hypothetical protein